MPMNEIDLKLQLNEAEDKAWRALGQYKFMMFGYWAAIWVHLNKIAGNNRRNPFGPLVELAQQYVEAAREVTKH